MRYIGAGRNPLIDLRAPNMLFGLAERVTAIESIRFVQRVLGLVKSRLPRDVHQGRLFSVLYGPDPLGPLCDLIYRCVAAKLVNVIACYVCVTDFILTPVDRSWTRWSQRLARATGI